MENLDKFICTENSGETNVVNSRKKGSLLEWLIKRIFQTIGFYATNTVVINNNQIDVFVNCNDIKILVQCKQYEKSTPPVKDLIHEWNSKRMEIKCDKALLVLWGYPKIEQDELKLAKKLKVYLWNDTLIEYFLNLSLTDRKKAKEEILLNLEINDNEAQKVINFMKEDIEKRFKDFSSENEGLVTLLKNEIFSCFKDGVLIRPKKFEIIWIFLKDKGYYIGPSDRMWISSDDSIFKYKNDFVIGRFIKRDGFDVIFLDAIDKDGVTLINSKQIFDEQ